MHLFINGKIFKTFIFMADILNEWTNLSIEKRACRGGEGGGD